MTARHRRRPRAFTLIEVLIVVGIIVVLGTLVLAAVFKAQASSRVIRTRSDLGVIENGLSAYKADFGDFPRFVDPSVDAAASAAATPDPLGGYAWLDYQTVNGGERGARLLCRAMIGPASAGVPGDAANPVLPGVDGNDGAGFRVRRTAVTNAVTLAVTLAGRPFGPYLQPDRWQLITDPNPSMATGGPFAAFYNAKLKDVYGNAILYYPATPGGGSRIHQAGGFCYLCNPKTFTRPPAGNTTMPGYPLYNAYDNSQDVTPPLSPTGAAVLMLDPAQMAYILGDRSMNGAIDSTEAAVTTEPYLLWSGGADGVYGFGPQPGTQVAATPTTPPNAFTAIKVDDITNFDIPADLHK